MSKKTKELVVHHNNLNESIYNFNELELNLFIVIICKMRNESENVVKFGAGEIKSLINSKNRSYSRFEKIIHGLQDRTIELKTEVGYKRVKPFPTLDFDLKNKTVEVEMNSKLIPQFKELKERFTKYLLEEFLTLGSKYSKRIFQLLKQYESIGKREILLEDLREFLECNTEGYKKLYLFENRILKPSVDDINNNTSLKVKYEKVKSGRTVTSIKFTMYSINSDAHAKDDQLKKESSKKISDKIEKAIEKAKKNIYVSKKWDFRTNAKITRMVKEYGEDYVENILKDLYQGCNGEIKTTVVQYLNGMIKKSSKRVQNVTAESESKEVPIVKNDAEIVEDQSNNLAYKALYSVAVSLIENETKGEQQKVLLNSLAYMKTVASLSAFIDGFKS